MKPKAPSAEDQLLNLFSVLFTQEGIIVLAVAMLVLGLMAAFRPLKWPALALLLWASVLGISNSPWFDNVLMFPIQTLRLQGRGITGGLLVALLVPTLMSGRGARTRLVLGGTVAFFVFELMMSARVTAAGVFSRGIVGGALFVLMFLVLGIGFSRWLQSVRDVHAAIWAIALAGILFVALTVLQLAVNRSAIVFGGRLFALTANPQTTGIFLAMTFTPAVYLLVRREVPHAWRLLLVIYLAISAVFLVWTGSRTGVLMAIISLGLLFRFRLGKLMLVGVVLGVFILLASQLYEESATGLGRIASAGNTRKEVWEGLLQQFRANPVIGVMGAADIGVMENSYLTTLARFGLVGFAFLTAALLLIGQALFHLQRLRPLLGEDRLLADLVTGQIVSICVGAVVEGILLANLSFWVFCFFIYLGILAFLLDPAWQTRPAHDTGDSKPGTSEASGYFPQPT